MRTLISKRASEARPIVITGGCGFIGCNIADALAQRGERVMLLDSLAREGSRENAHWLKNRHGDRIDIRVCDMRDRDAIRSPLAAASAVLHLAAQVAVTTSLDAPLEDFDINARGTLNVLECVRSDNPEIPLLFASTNKVYGRLFANADVRVEGDRYVPVEETHHGGIDERTPLDFYSPYGCSKGAADQYVRDYARVFGMRTAVLRMSCVYGPRQFGTEDQGWIAHFFLQAIRREALTIYGDGYQVRDALHVTDAADAWIAVLDNIDQVRGEVFNLGGGPDSSVSLRELLQMMSEMGRELSDIRYDSWRPGDQPWFVSNLSKLREAIQWAPKVSLREGLLTLDHWLSSRFVTPPSVAVEAHG
jgi:CDP-paratose 2-epimerase